MRKIRISVALDEEHAKLLKRYARKCRTSLSKVAAVIVGKALDYAEVRSVVAEETPDIAEEIAIEMYDMTEAEAPRYGERTRRHPRRDG